MKAFDLVQPSIDSTVSFYRKLDLEGWLKMGLVNTLSGSGGGGNPSVSSSSSGGGPTPEMPDPATFLKKWGPVIFVLGLAGVVLAAIGASITWLFTFLFYDIVDSGKINFDLFKRKSSVWQMVLYTLALGLLVLFVVSVGGGGLYAIYSRSETAAVPAFVLLVPLFLILFSLIFLFNTLVTNFAVPDVFYRKKSIWESLKASLPAVSKNLGESFFFLLAKLVLGAVASLILLIGALLLLVPLGLIAAMVALPFFLFAIFVSGPGAAAVAMVAAILALPLLFLFGLAVSSLTSPISFFMNHYTLSFYRNVLSKSMV